MRFEIRCYEHPHRFPKTPQEHAANTKARELRAPEWPPIVVTARGWDDAKILVKEEIAKRGRQARGIHVGTDKLIHAYVYTKADSQMRPQTMKASDQRYPKKR